MPPISLSALIGSLSSSLAPLGEQLSPVAPLLLRLTTISALLMTGLIWVIQIVHYPSFRFVSPERFGDFHAFHTRAISLIVIPVMLLELSSATLSLLGQFGSGVAPRPLELAAFTALLLVWLSTFALQVPLHGRLAAGPDPALIERLVGTNWIRTVLWSLRALLLLSIRP